MKPVLKKVLIALVIILIVLGGYFIYSTLKFRIVSSSPSGDILPNYSNEIVLFFNKELGNIDKSAVIITPPLGFDIKVGNKELHIILSQLPNSGRFTVQVLNVTSTGGDVIKKISKTYSIDYVTPDKLSDYDKKRALTESDSFEVRFPIIKSLPIYTTEFTIDYKFPNDTAQNAGKLTLIVDVVGINDNLKYAPDSGPYLSKIRAKALDKIRSMGFDPNSYIIEYTEK